MDAPRRWRRLARQLLLPGTRRDASDHLAALTATVATDGDALARATASAMATYLVAGGIGRMLVPSGDHAGLLALDPDVTLASGMRDCAPPLVHVYVYARPFGLAADLVFIDADLRSRPTVTRVNVHLGHDDRYADAVLAGSLLASSVLEPESGLTPRAARLTWWLDPTAAWRVDRATELDPDRIHDTPSVSALRERLERSHGALSALLADAEDAYPLEACGLVVERPGHGLVAIPCANLEGDRQGADPADVARTSRTAFALDTRELARASGRGDRILAVYHSHVDTEARPSREDRAGASPFGEPDLAQIIVQVLGGRAIDWRVFDGSDQ